MRGELVKYTIKIVILKGVYKVINYIKNLFKRNEAKEEISENNIKNKKYLVKKVIYEEIVDENKLKEIISEYNMQIKPKAYAKKDGVNIMCFQPRPEYRLDIEEMYEEDFDEKEM